MLILDLQATQVITGFTHFIPIRRIGVVMSP